MRESDVTFELRPLPLSITGFIGLLDPECPTSAVGVDVGPCSLLDHLLYLRHPRSLGPFSDDIRVDGTTVVVLPLEERVQWVYIRLERPDR